MRAGDNMNAKLNGKELPPPNLEVLKKTKQRVPLPLMPLLGLLLILAFMLSMNLGRYGIPFHQVAAVFANKLFGWGGDYPKTLDTVLFNIRIPRILSAILVGSALAS